ncbi:DNA-binding MarR family transcriptional regulator [Sphaerisporangium siamense]|uniref:DNA-binding MarR family transcriptional regulator n=2 Tax=Sphaerisporangium siamense TaxID=795645 RepID=A0A7W7DDW0_9ACTN|nr:DNA-binding MarR family transcriptional regulator [Sphaerisporangium siamense]
MSCLDLEAVMSLPDEAPAAHGAEEAAESRAQGWRRLAALHSRIEDALERALQREHDLSVVEYAVLDVLSRQDEHHLRMQQLACAIVLSQSATTRLVTRLENRGLLGRYLCPTDRRGIYTEVTEAGRALLAAARPTHDTVLAESLTAAAGVPELASLARALEGERA